MDVRLVDCREKIKKKKSHWMSNKWHLFRFMDEYMKHRMVCGGDESLKKSPGPFPEHDTRNDSRGNRSRPRAIHLQCVYTQIDCTSLLLWPFDWSPKKPGPGGTPWWFCFDTWKQYVEFILWEISSCTHINNITHVCARRKIFISGEFLIFWSRWSMRKTW